MNYSFETEGHLQAVEELHAASNDYDHMTASETGLRRSERAHKPPSYLTDYVCSSLPASGSVYCCSTLTNVCASVSGIKVKEAPVNTFISEPQSFEEACLHKGWQDAMKAEIQALNENHTWDIVSLLPGKKAISNRWVYKTKYKADGTVERLKGRIVVRGFTRKAGVDYTETFSPLVKHTTIRCLMAVAIKKGWNITQLDVNNAFLHGDLHEEIYMKLPQGVDSDIPNVVCRLKKSLYGLKQASRQWYAKLTEVLYRRGCKHSDNDYSLFYRANGNMITFLGVYVDDIVLTGNDDHEASELKNYLNDEFKIKDLGGIHYFLGIEFLKDNNGMIMTQRKFTQELLIEFECQNSKTASSPLDPSCKLSPTEGQKMMNPTLYRKLIGKLNFLMHTRPDIAFAVQHLSQYMQDPIIPHFSAALRVLRYLKGTPDLGIVLSNNNNFELQAYCDSDWAACPHTRRSVSGFVVFLGETLVSWKSKKQGTLSLSSAEAEYRSLRRTVAEIAWLTRLLHELTVTSISPVPVRCDNQAAIHIAKNPVYHERTKHIELDCHFVREKVLDGLIRLSYVSTKDQLANFLTKPVNGEVHYQLPRKLGMNTPLNLKGGVGADLTNVN